MDDVTKIWGTILKGLIYSLKPIFFLSWDKAVHKSRKVSVLDKFLLNTNQNKGINTPGWNKYLEEDQSLHSSLLFVVLIKHSDQSNLGE